MTEAGSLGDLVETLLRWSVDDASSAEVVHDAAQAIAEGKAAEWVVALACLPPDASAFDIEDILQQATPELPFPFVPRGNSEVVLGAALAVVRRYATGRLTERDLVRWMHTFVGHDRSEELEPLVRLDDVYDTVEYSSGTTESVDAEVRAEVNRLLRLHPDV